VSWFVNLRAGPFGAVCDPYVLQGDIAADPPGMVSTPYEAIPAIVKARNVLLATHGFNVDYVNGLRSLGRLESLVAPTASEVVLGVLWPGDWVIPAVNYPFEEKVAKDVGKRLAAFCNRWLAGAASLSFASHSLGARVVLEAVAGLNRNARQVCITAGAIGADCLAAEYEAAAARADSIVTLSSMEDKVLSLAYPVGDFIADLLDQDHKLFERALGREGPERPFGPQVTAAQIPDQPPYDHGDYFPPANLALPSPDPASKWSKATDFVIRAFRGAQQSWPP
jgi:hypothetical protein